MVKRRRAAVHISPPAWPKEQAPSRYAQTLANARDPPPSLIVHSHTCICVASSPPASPGAPTAAWARARAGRLPPKEKLDKAFPKSRPGAGPLRPQVQNAWVGSVTCRGVSKAHITQGHAHDALSKTHPLHISMDSILLHGDEPPYHGPRSNAPSQRQTVDLGLSSLGILRTRHRRRLSVHRSMSWGALDNFGCVARTPRVPHPCTFGSPVPTRLTEPVVDVLRNNKQTPHL